MTGARAESGGSGAARTPARDGILLVRLEWALSRVLVVALTLGGAAWLAREVARPAVAAHLAARATTVAELEEALAWAPAQGDLQRRLGEAYAALLDEADIERAQRHVEAALRLRPTHALTWLQLAALADRRGDGTRARTALEAALRLDRHNVVLRWEAALLTLRWGEREAALEHLRYVLAVDPARRDAAFQLAVALLGPGEPVARLLPSDAEPLTGLLQTAIRLRHVALGRAAWERRIALEPPLDPQTQRRYVEMLLEEREGLAARAAWLVIVPDGRPALPGEAVWNGGFEAASLLGWGLDWRVRRVWGVDVALDRAVAARGQQSLRLAFNSFPTLDFAGLAQHVVVEPGREYRLRALVKATDFVTRSGLKLQVVGPDDEVLAETAGVAGTTADWVPVEARVRIPSGVPVVQVRLRREKAPGPEGNLGGRVWVDAVSLAPAGGGTS